VATPRRLAGGQPRYRWGTIMKFRAILAVLALTLVTWNARAADEENPYKKAKVGDYVNYTLTTKFGTFNIPGTMTEMVTAKTDKEATVKITGHLTIGDQKMELPAQTSTIDLTKPYDPAKTGALPGGAEAKLEKVKDGKEKVKVGDKEYECTWTTYKAKMKVNGQEIDGEVKAWTSKDQPIGMVKMVMNADVAGQKMEVTMEMKETGNKKP
jgi:hypothetical protein